MAKRDFNENYKHDCSTQRVKASDYISALSCGIYTNEEFKSIIEFFVLNAPVLKADKADAFGLKNLRNFGWRGTFDMNKLERELLKASQLPFLCFIRSSSCEW